MQQRSVPDLHLTQEDYGSQPIDLIPRGQSKKLAKDCCNQEEVPAPDRLAEKTK